MDLQTLLPGALEHKFAPVVRILGKGKTGSRSLNFDEAKYAMTMILKGEVEDVQLGAFLMLLRVKEESPEEIAGFVAAVREVIQPRIGQHEVTLDWPSYAGKRSQHPWFVLAAKLLNAAGIKVLFHGSAGHTEGRLYTEQVMADMGLPICDNNASLSEALDTQGIAYLPLEKFCPELQRIIDLRNTLGLRSPVHTLARLINPLTAPYSMQSVFHPAYADIHQSAAQILAASHTAVFKGESGEIERKPDANTTVRFHSDGESFEEVWPRLQDTRQDNVNNPSTFALRELWHHDNDDYGRQAVIGTAAIALRLCRAADNRQAAEALAQRLWQQRALHQF